MAKKRISPSKNIVEERAVDSRPFSQLFLGGSFGFLLLIFGQPTLAAQSDCQPRSYSELVKCAFETSTAIEVQEKRLDSAQHLESAAGQLVNPELEADTVHKGSDASETEAALLFTLELGGKRSARKIEARAEASRVQATTELEKSRIKLEIVLGLYRLSHLKRERAIEEESVATYSKVVGQYQNRPALNPEQEVSLSVFRMAVSDHRLRLDSIKAEEEKILQEILSSTRLSKEQILGNLPDRKSSWPEIADSAATQSSPQTRIAQAELLSAQSVRARAQGDSWPDLKLGPMIKLQKEAGTQETYFGATVSLPLPIFSLNQGGRALGEAKVREAELALSATSRAVEGKRSQLARNYRQYVASLKSVLTAKELEQKHGQIERLFFKGLVPSSLVIEAHRQLFELEERRNEIERSAIETLGSIYILDNAFSGVIL